MSKVLHRVFFAILQYHLDSFELQDKGFKKLEAYLFMLFFYVFAMRGGLVVLVQFWKLEMESWGGILC